MAKSGPISVEVFIEISFSARNDIHLIFADKTKSYDHTVVAEGLAKVFILVWFWWDFSALRCLSFFTCCIRACFPIFVTETSHLHTVQNAACLSNDA